MPPPTTITFMLGFHGLCSPKWPSETFRPRSVFLPADSALLDCDLRVFHRLERLELDIKELAADFLDGAHIVVVEDITLLIDGGRSARAFPCCPTHCSDQRVAVGDPVALAQGLIDQVHAVVAADHHEVRTNALILLERGNERLVHW